MGDVAFTCPICKAEAMGRSRHAGGPWGESSVVEQPPIGWVLAVINHKRELYCSDACADAAVEHWFGPASPPGTVRGCSGTFKDSNCWGGLDFCCGLLHGHEGPHGPGVK